ncbi:hypothetical protein LZU85_16020 [Vibrio sp. IRLE0018]|uniref:surface carbohydrate biosynthesis protein n=1 Tax=Vibrio floridensis TaxID=2908007 RepID=UPI001F312752|nr:surface carbohydrate biosynthesis protein [Vibrio floridensis]MCF8780318.1 hypothetical protein [Vibrio floridensis]
MTKKYLYLPIETKVRELDAKLLVAMEALYRGYDVIIGEDTFLQKIDQLPEGMIFHKDALSIRTELFKNARACGHKVAVNDEEGSVVHYWERYISKRIGEEALSYTDLFLCWGREQYAQLSHSFKNGSAKMAVTGHPRIDLLREPFRHIYGEQTNEIILVNTHFSLCNYIDGADKLIALFERTKVLTSPQDYERHARHVEYKSQLMNEYAELVRAISEQHPKQKIVIRPHPSENPLTWETMFKHYENVVVTKEHSVGYWIKRALLVIHTGCTTAIETFYSDKPAVAYKPIKSSEFEVYLPDSISIAISNKMQCLELIEQLMDGCYDLSSYFENASKIMEDNIDTQVSYSCEKIMNLIDNNLHPAKRNRSIKSIFLGLSIKRKIINLIKSILRITENNKFEKTSKEEVECLLKKLTSLSSRNEMIDYKVHELLHNVFYIESKSV